MSDIIKFSRKRKKIEVELDDGSFKNIELIELTPNTFEEYWQLQIDQSKRLYEACKKNQEKIKGEDGEFGNILNHFDALKDLDKEKTRAENEEMFRIMTGEDDVSWIHRIPITAFYGIIEAFEADDLNPKIGEAKKNIETIQKITTLQELKQNLKELA